MSAWVWLVIGFLCVIVEVFTTTFYFLILGAAAFVATLIALFTGSLSVQAIGFAGAALLLLWQMRPLLLRRFGGNAQALRSNSEALVGKKAVVIAAIDADHPGRVKVGDVDWAATTPSGHLPVGTVVRIAEVKGAHLVVISDDLG
ncbi:MAG: NfeD family protein [Firmicutes bacterium]|nr:NfeD family protein [Bacillota bacterium]